MPIRRWITSANYAIEGILFAARTQRHVRYHLYSAVIVMLLSYILGVARADFLVVSIAVILVLLAEMINTAIEFVVDIISPDYREKARIAKDVSAGAVFITAFGAAVLGYIVLFPYFNDAFEKGVFVAKHSKQEITLIAVILVMIVVVILKAYFGKGHPLRGGMPSGHSAMAFSAWAAVTYSTENFTASILCFILSTLVARSRIKENEHTAMEVFVGAVLGAGMTWLMFFLFY